MAKKQEPQNFCHHVAANGNLCRALPLREEAYCYFHMMTRERLHRRREADRRKLPLVLPVLEDQADIQLALTDLANAVLSGAVDSSRGYLALSALQTARKNLIGLPRFSAYNNHFTTFYPEQLSDGSEPDPDQSEAVLSTEEDSDENGTPPKLAPESVDAPPAEAAS